MADDEAPNPATEPAAAAASEPAPAPAEPASPATSPEPSLLETFKDAPAAESGEPAAAPAEGEPKPSEGEKPAEPPKVKEPKPEPGREGEVTAEPPASEPIVYENFVLPEGFELDEARIGGFRELAAEARVPQEQAQKLLDLHTSAMRDYADHMSREQHRVFNDTRKAWRTEVQADPEMGGSGFQTAMSGIARIRDLGVKPDERAAFNEFLTVTGAGDHPAFLRMMHNLSKRFGEPQSAPPAPAPTQNPTTKDRRATLYDHPRST